MQLDEQSEAFVFHFGEMGSRWGFNRTVGQILAAVVICEDPVCADELMDALSVSRGNVSMGLKELQSWQLIKRAHLPGDRKEYFTANGNIWELATRVLEERRKRELDPTLSLLRTLLMNAKDGDQEDHAQQQMSEIHDLLEMLSTWSVDLQKLNPDNLRSLMKLGAGVSKVLDFKGKLIK
jgi:DNA-binding transcriptional regulator GbsR (MarR family)